MYLHDPIFGTNKNRILKNGSCERAFMEKIVMAIPSKRVIGIKKKDFKNRD